MPLTIYFLYLNLHVMITIVTNFIFPRLHYLFYATFSLITGITFYYLYPEIYVSLVISIISVVGVAIAHYCTSQKDRLLLCTPLFFFAGSALCFYQHQKFRTFYEITQDKKITLKGTVSSIEKIYHSRFKRTLTLDIFSVTTQDRILNLNTTVVLYMRDTPEIRVGDTIEVYDIVIKRSNRDSYTNYLVKEKIAATVFLESFAYFLIKRPRFSVKRYLAETKSRILLDLKTKINSETFQLFSSIFLGNRALVKKQMDKTKEPFKIWGTSHYLARSGLHLVIFVLIWHFILSLLPISYRLKQFSLLLLILMYALLSWSSVSFERAVLMVAIYKLCNLYGVGCHYIHLVVLVTALILLHNPYQLFFLDFQLSFGMTFALAWFNHIEARKKLSYS